MAEAKTTADEARVVDETEVDKLGTNHVKEGERSRRKWKGRGRGREEGCREEDGERREERKMESGGKRGGERRKERSRESGIRREGVLKNVSLMPQCYCGSK